MSFLTRCLAAFAAGALTLSLTACGGDAETPARADGSAGGAVTVEHAQGTTTLDKAPERIVVLDLGSLDTVDALGHGDKVVGIPKGTKVPEAVSKYADEKIADVGSVKEPDLEKIAELNPDLVVLGFRSAALYPEISKNFKAIDVTFDSTKLGFYEGIEYSTNVIAKALQAEEKAATELAEVKQALADAKAKAPKDKKAMILMTSGGKVSLHGPTSRFGMIHTELGYAVAMEPSKDESHGDAVSFEAIAQANPDALFAVDRDAAVGQEGQNAEVILDNELVASTKAWKDGKVTYLDASRWYILIHGVNNAVEMINAVAKDL